MRQDGRESVAPKAGFGALRADLYRAEVGRKMKRGKHRGNQGVESSAAKHCASSNSGLQRKVRYSGETYQPS